MQNINKQNEGLICLSLTTFYFLLITWSSRELIISNSASTEVSSLSNIYSIKIFCTGVFDEKSHNAFSWNFCIQTANVSVVIADFYVFYFFLPYPGQSVKLFIVYRVFVYKYYRTVENLK